MKQLLFICAMVLSTTFASASWFRGSVVLNDDQVLVGEISIESKHNTVLLRRDDKVDVYPAHKIRSVRLYDEGDDINRKYISIRNPSSVFNQYQLYEVVVAGELSLLRTERSDVAVTKDDHEAFGYRYVVRYKGEFSSLKKFRSRIYPKIKHMPGVGLPSYIRSNHLNPNNESNAVRIIQYYNSVIGSMSEVAMN